MIKVIDVPRHLPVAGPTCGSTAAANTGTVFETETARKGSAASTYQPGTGPTATSLSFRPKIDQVCGHKCCHLLWCIGHSLDQTVANLKSFEWQW
jgi:hypothetical protein